MNKTPISLLQELMVKRGEIPQYDLLPSEGVGTHHPTYYYRVTAGPVRAVGKASSKQDAKHEAARVALDKLAEHGIFHPVHVSANLSPVSTSDPSSPVKVQVNAIGCLLEFCSEKNIPQPDFVLTGDVGPPHSRNFTMECRIAGMVVSATDTTKKRAKQLAAQKMLHRLQDTLPEDLQDMQAINTPALTDEVIAKYKETSILGKKKVNWGQKISSYPRSIKNIMQEKNISYSELWKDADECNSDSLQDVLNKLELNYTLDIRENGGSWICFVSLNTEPEFLNADIDTSKDVAVSKSIMKTYTFLKIMSE